MMAARAGRGFILRPTRPLLRRLPAVRTPYEDYVLANGPLVYHPLNEVSGAAVDISGNGWNMLSTGSPTRSQPSLVVSTTGKSIAFPADGDYFGANLSTVSQVNAAWSVEAWVKPSTSSQSLCGIFTSGYDGSKQPWCLGMTGTANYPFAGFYNGGWNRAESTIDMANGSTYHLVGTWDGTDLKIYVNGTLDVTDTPGVSPGSASHSDYYIARRWDNTSTFRGAIDEVALYTRALTAAEILLDYQAGIGTATGDPGSAATTSRRRGLPQRAWRGIAAQQNGRW